MDMLEDTMIVLQQISHDYWIYLDTPIHATHQMLMISTINIKFPLGVTFWKIKMHIVLPDKDQYACVLITISNNKPKIK